MFAHLFILDVLLFTHRADVIHPERQYVSVGNGIHNGVDMQPLAERLFGGLQIKLTTRAGVVGEYRCARKTEQMVFLEFLHDSRVHLAKLAAVAFIEISTTCLP